MSIHGGPAGWLQHAAGRRREAFDFSGSTPCGKFISICTPGLKPSTSESSEAGTGVPCTAGTPCCGIVSWNPVGVDAGVRKKLEG